MATSTPPPGIIWQAELRPTQSDYQPPGPPRYGLLALLVVGGLAILAAATWGPPALVGRALQYANWGFAVLVGATLVSVLYFMYQRRSSTALANAMWVQLTQAGFRIIRGQPTAESPTPQTVLLMHSWLPTLAQDPPRAVAWLLRAGHDPDDHALYLRLSPGLRLPIAHGAASPAAQPDAASNAGLAEVFRVFATPKAIQSLGQHLAEAQLAGGDLLACVSWLGAVPQPTLGLDRQQPTDPGALHSADLLRHWQPAPPEVVGPKVVGFRN